MGKQDMLLTREDVMGLGLSDVRLLDPNIVKMLEAQLDKVKQHYEQECEYIGKCKDDPQKPDYCPKQKGPDKLRIKNPFEKKLPVNDIDGEGVYFRGCYFGFEKCREKMKKK